MKIFYITNLRIPTEKAHGHQIANNCSALKQNCIDIVLVGAKRKSHIEEDYFQYYNIKNRFRIIKLPCLDLINMKLIPKKISWFLQNITFSISAFIYALFKTKNSDIIYSRDPLTVFLLLFIRKNIYYEANDKLLANNLFNRRIIKRIRGVIAVNNYLKNKYQEFFKINENKVLVARNGIWLDNFNVKKDKFALRGELGLPINKYIIGYIGKLKTIGMDKGLKQAIQAVAQARKKNNEIVLCCVGGSPEDIREYYKKGERAGLDRNSLILIGHINPSIIPKYLKAFDLLLMNFPDIPHYAKNMSPIKMFEYMASGRPILASSLPSIKEVLSKDCALFVRPDDLDDLIKKIEYSYIYRELMVKIGKKAQEKAKEYDWSVRANRIINFIQENLYENS